MKIGWRKFQEEQNRDTYTIIRYQKGHSQQVFILREYSSNHGEKRNVSTCSKQTFREVGNLHILHDKLTVNLRTSVH